MIEKYILRDSKETILDNWARLSRQNCPAALDKSIHAVRDHVPQLLDAFYEAIEAKVASRPVELSKIHGRQRFTFKDYTLPQVLSEYALLKQVLFNELNAISELTFEDFFFIDNFFDSAAAIAANEFVSLREQELKRSAHDLQIINEDLERFSAVAAHDLRSPATTIISYCDILLDQIDNPEAQSLVEAVRRTGQRITHLVEQLLQYAKIGKCQYSAQEVSLHEAVNGAMENLAAQIEKIHAEIEIGELPHILGDKILLIQLFQNLFSNSLKFHSPHRKLHLKIFCREENGYNIVFVEDNGVGFDAAVSQEIFEPFKRGENSRHISGSGLGLATVERVMELHNGTVHAEGAINEGARFILSFPKLRHQEAHMANL